MSILTTPAIASFLKTHANHRSGSPPIAVFDCDGTVIHGDIGESMFYRQIEHFFFRRSPAEFWPDHPRRDELDRRYRSLARLAPADRQAASDFTPFADLLITWYTGQIAAGSVHKACADIVRLCAGYTLAEVRSFAEDNWRTELSTKPARRSLGNGTVRRGVRFIREAWELITALRACGFQIWAVSGSNRWSVEPAFRTLGIPAERVVGLELLEREGILTDQPLEPIPIREGKVPALRGRTTEIPLLVASDSKNDIPLFLYSAGLKVRINSRKRDTADFFRSANISPDESWVLIEDPTVIP